MPNQKRKMKVQTLLHCAALLTAAGCSVFQSPPPPPPPPVSLGAAAQALQANQPDAAIADAQQSLREQPSGTFAAQAWYLEGRGYELKVSTDAGEVERNLVQARSCYLEALHQNPTGSLEGDIHASLCNVTFYQDDFAESIRQASAAIPLLASPVEKANLLYRKGVCQQRMGEFTDADQTFRQVEQRYSGTAVADSAHQHEGLNSFYVQLATFSNHDAANQAAMSLGQGGVIISQRTDNKGQTIIDDGPFSTYADAKKVKLQLQKSFPQALIVP